MSTKIKQNAQCIFVHSIYQSLIIIGVVTFSFNLLSSEQQLQDMSKQELQDKANYLYSQLQQELKHYLGKASDLNRLSADEREQLALEYKEILELLKKK